jgi:ribosomal protein S27AE
MIEKFRKHEPRKPTKNWVDRICLNCNGNFKTMPYRVRVGQGLFCSRKCLNISNGNKVGSNAKGENNNAWKGGLTKDRVRYKKIYESRYPEKAEVHRIVRNAIKSGKLIAEPCEKCEKTNRIHAHHDDYSKPLDVRWLCAKCHHKEHHS